MFPLEAKNYPPFHLRDYKYSRVLSENPWVVLPEQKYKPGSILLEGRADKVVQALNRKDIVDIMWNSCSIRTKNMWSKTVSEEEMPYKPFVCYQGAEIISRLFTLQEPYSFDFDPEIRPFTQWQATTLQQFYFLFGVFQVLVLNKYEPHSFVVWITSEFVRVYNTYGGLMGVIIIQYPREEWLEMFAEFNSYNMEEQARFYPKLWGLDEEDTEYIFERDDYRGIDITDVSYTRIL